MAATLQIPKPLLVTRAYCSELVIKVPSWSAADKFMQEPLSLRVVDLFLDVKSAADCDEAFLKAAEARVQAAIMEPDPLGSIASWYAFSTVISERLELLVDNVYIKVFVKGVSRIRVELTGFHSRTTNAMWQDMRDLTTCVDRSPDGLLKTRFKFVSFSCSVLLTASKSSSGDTASSSAPPLQLLHDHEVTLRMTLFGHRQSKSQSWETLSQVIDVNLHTLPFDYDIAQLLQIYEVYATVSGWIREAAAQERSAQEAGAGLPSSPSMLLHHHQIQRGQVMKTKSDDEQVDSEASFALQLTFRFTADAKLRFTSERLGKQHLALTAQHAAVNLIVQHDNVRELQITVHEVKVLFQDVLVLFLKPNRDVMQLKQLRESVFVKWHLQKLMCNIEGDLALVINEAYHAHNEKEQSAFIKCGTCLQQIRLESIETHVCGPPLSPTTARSLSDAQTSSQSERFDHGAADPGSLPGNGEKGGILDSTTIPRLRIVFALDEIELNVDSHAFHNVQQLMRSSSYNSGKSLVERKFCVQMRELSVTTEAKEFVGDAIFVPMLPLAFQMLECTLQGCGCVHKKSKTKDASSSRTNSESTRSDSGSIASSSSRRPRWPERVFVELAHLECTAKSPQLSSLASFFVAEAISVRSSFSDGAQICANCHPQLSLHASVDRIRFQVDHPAFQFIRKTLSEAHRPLQSAVIVTKTLFLAVLEIRAIEFTLLEAQASATTAARLKNLFRQVSIVGDNQLGHLALQSSLDFRSLFNSQLVRFFHRGAVAAASLMGTSASTETESSSDASQSQKTLTKTQCRRIRLEHERQSAAQVIQRLFRRHTTPRHHNKTPSAQLEATEPLTTSSHGSNGALGVHDGLENGGERCDSKAERRATKSGHLMSLVLDDEPVTLPNKRKGSHGSGSRFGVPEDLVNANRKMVAAASVITKFVKNTQQQLESEVVGLATHSKESAARLVLPGYSACKKMFGLDALSPSSSAKPKTIELIDSDLEYKTKAHELRNVDTDMETVGRRTGSASSSSRSVTMEPTESMDVIHLGDHEDERRRSHESSTRSEDEGPNGQVEKNGGAADGDDPLDTSDRSHRVDSICEESGDQNDNDDHDDQEVEETEADEEADDDGEYEGEKDDEENYSPLASQHQRQQEEEEELHTHEAEFGLDESLLATLPAVIRVLVQVGEHRVRVPINPREKVGFLCREVVRRFNETFTSSSSSSGNGNRVISHVTLQDSRGGVFAATDVVGFVYASESEVLFALPHQPDTKIRSVAHIEPSCMAPSTSSKPKRGPPKTSKLSRRVGCKFSRCSQLPLPLAIALLANENERDLMRCVLNDGSVGCGNNGSNTGKQVDEWPELALNVNFLDPKQMLPVEVRWFGSCLEVTNVDAFVLCLQQLGLCTSRPSSKHVGKILRERLKMDAKSAFIRSACLRSSEFAVSRPNEEAAAGGGEEDAPAREDRELEGLVSVSYASLKEIVQEDFGVYTSSNRPS